MKKTADISNIIPHSVKDIFRNALKQAAKVSWMLLKIYIPVSILTAFLDQVGFLDLIAPFFEPLMKLLGLPGEASLVLIAAWVNNLFAALAAMSVMDLTFRQITIIAVITGFAHNLILETGVLTKLKMARPQIALTRIVFGLLVGMLLNLIMPETIQGFVTSSLQTSDFTWSSHLLGILRTGVQILLLMSVIMLVYEFMLIWKKGPALKKKLEFLPRALGLSSGALGAWMVGFFIGIAYGAGILFKMHEDNKLTPKDTALLTLALCLVHAVIEDTMIFVVVGANLWWILGVRLILLIIMMFILSRGNTYRHLQWLGLPREEKIT